MKTNFISIFILISTFVANDYLGAASKSKDDKAHEDEAFVYIDSGNAPHRSGILGAIQDGNFKIVQEILQKNPKSLYRKDHQNNTTLHLATEYKHLEIVEYLIEIYKKNKEHYAFEDFENGEAYFDRHLFISRKNDSKKTARDSAAANVQTAKLLPRNEVGQREYEKCKAILHCIQNADSNGAADDEEDDDDMRLYAHHAVKKFTFEELAKADRDGNTALHHAVLQQDEKAVAHLLSIYKTIGRQATEDLISLKNKNGKSALEIARASFQDLNYFDDAIVSDIKKQLEEALTYTTSMFAEKIDKIPVPYERKKQKQEHKHKHKHKHKKNHTSSK